MSFVQNYGIHDPIVDDDVETIFEDVNSLEDAIDEQVALELAEEEELQDAIREQEARDNRVLEEIGFFSMGGF